MAKVNGDWKRRYHEIMKTLHPDANPALDERKRELLLKTMEAYRKGDLPMLRAVYQELAGEGLVPDIGTGAGEEDILRELGRLSARLAHFLQDGAARVKNTQLGQDLFGDLDLEEQVRNAGKFYKEMGRRIRGGLGPDV